MPHYGFTVYDYRCTQQNIDEKEREFLGNQQAQLSIVYDQGAKMVEICTFLKNSRVTIY